jgi:insulysin
VLGLKVDPARFAVIKERQARDYVNMRYEQPYQVALYSLALMTEARRWHVEDYEDALQELEVADVEAFIPRVLRTCRIEAFAAGNLPAEMAAAMARRTEEGLRAQHGARPPRPSQRVLSEARVVRLPAGGAFLRREPAPNPANDNSAVVIAFQVGRDDPATNALADLLTHCAKRDAFHQLRTVEQLGYLVFFTAYSTLTVHNVAFILQSSEHSAAHLEARVHAFLPSLSKKLQAMPDDELEAHKEELARAKLEKPKRLREAAARDWREIDDGTLRFARDEDEVARLRTISKAELLEFFNTTVVDPTQRRMLTVRVEAARGAAAQELLVEGVEAPISQEEIVDVWEWKARQELFSSFR